MPDRPAGAVFDASVPSPARVYDYLAGGRDNYAADRGKADELAAINPDARACVANNRAFLERAVAWAAGEGITQFLDLGCGFPPPVVTAGGGTKVVYVDSDPVVASHAHALLRGPGVAVLKTDLRDTAAVETAAGHAGIDLGEPVCVVLGAVLHFLGAREAGDVVAAYTALLAPGSVVVVSVWATSSDQLAAEITAAYPGRLYRHSREDVAGWLAGLELVAPGVTCARAWQPRRPVPLEPQPSYVIAGVGVKRG